MFPAAAIEALASKGEKFFCTCLLIKLGIISRTYCNEVLVKHLEHNNGQHVQPNNCQHLEHSRSAIWIFAGVHCMDQENLKFLTGAHGRRQRQHLEHCPMPKPTVAAVQQLPLDVLAD